MLCHKYFSRVNLFFPLCRFYASRQQLALNPNTTTGKLLEKLGVGVRLEHPKKILGTSARRLYICCTEMVDYDKFFREMRLEDTFNAWFRILTLHTWLLFVRLTQEGNDGRYVKSRLLTDLWHDVEVRLNKLGRMKSKIKLQGQRDMVGQLQFAFIAYDEGLLSHDRVLAGSLWRILFESRVEDPILLEQMVHYVRKQIQHLETQKPSTLLEEGIATFLPLDEEKLNLERTNAVKDMLNFRITY